MRGRRWVGAGMLATALAASVQAQPSATTTSHGPPEGFVLGATRAQAVRQCRAADGTPEDDTRIAVVCSLPSEDDGLTERVVSAALCGARVCRIDVVREQHGPRTFATLAQRARDIATRVGAGLGAFEDSGDRACTAAVFGGIDTCIVALPAGQYVAREWTIATGGFARVRLRHFTGEYAALEETWVDARGVEENTTGPDGAD